MKKIERKYIKYVPLHKWYEWNLHIKVTESMLNDEKFIKYARKRKNLESIRLHTLEAISEGFTIVTRKGEYALKGIMITNEDYYYMCVNDETNDYRLCSCVGHMSNMARIGEKVVYKCSNSSIARV